MLGKKYLEEIKRKKEALQQAVQRQRATIDEYDRVAQSESDLQESEYDRYLEFTQELDRMKKQLQILRMEDDGFILQKGTTKILLDVTSKGEMMFFRVIPTVEPVIPPDMASFAYCKLELAEDGAGYEIRYMESKRYIDELRMVVPKNNVPTDISSLLISKINEVLPANQQINTPQTPAVEPNSVKFEWKTGSDIYYTADPNELVEVIGSHLNRHKKTAIIEVNKLRDLYEFKQTAYDSNNREHEDHLMTFWNTLRPDEILISRKSAQWKNLGFQGTDPATDFRGMGLLGLHNLQYYVENNLDQVKQVLDMPRDYPFAVAGINITSMLLEIFDVNDSINAKNSPVWDNEFLIFLCRANSDDPENSGFEEIYCMAMSVLDRLWLDLDAKYMDFPRVLKLVRQQLKQVVSARPADWEDFRNRIQHILITRTPDSPVSQRHSTAF